MANLVYNMVCDAFADLISRRAAENLVKEALKDIGSHPDRVTALEMQELLRKGIFKRLQKIIPVMKAKGEIKRLLRNLEKTLAQPSSATEDSEDWDEPDAEAVDLSPWEVQTALGPNQVRPQSGAAQPTPVSSPLLEPQRVSASASPGPSLAASSLTNDSLAGDSSASGNTTGLDFLAVPLNPEARVLESPLPEAQPPEARPPEARPPEMVQSERLSPQTVALESPTFAQSPSEPLPTLSTALEASTSPVARKDGEAEMSTDERLIAPPMTPPESPSLTPLPSNSTFLTDADPVQTAPSESELLQAPEEGPEGADLLEFDADLFGDAEDLFEFEATDLAALSGLIVPLEPKPALREYKRQDAILSRIALENGVSNVMLSLRSGEVLHARVNRTEPRTLAAAVAHAACPVEGGVAPGLFYADLDGSMILIAPLDDQVLLSILAASSTNIGRLLAEIIALKEEL